LRQRGSRGAIFSHCNSLNNKPDRGIGSPFHHVIRHNGHQFKAESVACTRF
jgi:hypothetical protein